jgi:hypothetical protein
MVKPHNIMETMKDQPDIEIKKWTDKNEIGN